MPPPNLVTKIKVQLKLSIARLRMVQQRDEALAKVARRDMAKLLELGKEDSARIRVENIIRSDITSELHEILELYCELLVARAGLLDSPVCDPGLEEAVKSIIYAAPKTEIKELQQVRFLLAERYGKDFVHAAMDNTDSKVSPKVVRKLSVTPPREALVQGYLEEIAKAYGVRWPPRADEDGELLGDAPSLLDDDEIIAGDGGGDGGGGGDVAEQAPSTPRLSAEAKQAKAREALTRATPPRTVVGSAAGAPLHVNPPSPSTDNIHPKVTLNAQELKPPPTGTSTTTTTTTTTNPKTVASGGARPAAAPRSSALADPAAKRLVAKKKDNVDDELARRFAELKR